MGALGSAASIGTALQVLMVVAGHFMPAAREAGLFPVAGTLIGLVTGWLSGAGGAGAALSGVARRGAVAGGVGGVIGSLVSTALGDVPLGNLTIAGASTLVMGALGAVARSRLGGR